MNVVINGNTYLTQKKLDTFSQLHLARKLAPALPIVEGMLSEEEDASSRGLLSILLFSKLDEKESEFVVNKCLSMVVRQQDKGFVKLQAPNGSFMFDDLDLDAILQLTVLVIEENLGDFFRTVLISS